MASLCSTGKPSFSSIPESWLTREGVALARASLRDDSFLRSVINPGMVVAMSRSRSKWHFSPLTGAHGTVSQSFLSRKLRSPSETALAIWKANY